MNRFANFAVWLLTLGVCFGVGAKPRAAWSAEKQAKPNIVFILIDDMGWPDLACYGHPFHETPHLDKFATQGMMFSNFYAATPVCSSTRSTIQSGQYSARTGITDFIPGHWRPFEKLVVPKVDHNLKPGVKTPGDVLKAAGYATGYFGKWHLGRDRQHQPDMHGYDITERQLGQPFQQWRTKHGSKEPGPKRIDLLTDQTLYFIDKHRKSDKPFFITLSHHSVHIRIEARNATQAKYEKKKRPATGVNNPAYAAMVEDLDATIGTILAKLDEWKLTDNTIVVVTSDNGGLRQIYTGVGDIVSSNYPLRDEKGTLYEGGIRVPMIVRWPGVTEPNSICGVPTTTADLLPTFCQMSAASMPKQPIDGASLTPLLKDPDANWKRDAIYFHYPHYHHSRPGSAIRQGDWKLIEWLEDGSVELYNLNSDHGEKTNLAGKKPELAKQLRDKLAKWRKDVGARMPTVNTKHDPKRAQEWWSRRTNKPLDIEAMRKRYETQRAK